MDEIDSEQNKYTLFMRLCVARFAFPIKKETSTTGKTADKIKAVCKYS